MPSKRLWRTPAPRLAILLLAACLLTGSALASDDVLAQGQAAYDRGDFPSALILLTPLAERGVAQAQNTLGRMYISGEGVLPDHERALALFRRAAAQGLPNAQNNLGLMYAGGMGVEQDFQQAVAWLEKAAHQGFEIAMANLADLYESGYGVRKDPAVAHYWRQKSQGMAPPRAKDEVPITFAGGADYQRGLALYMNFRFKEAFPHLLAAASKGHPEAQLKLESMYRHGQGVQQDTAQADAWAGKAAVQGYSNHDGRDRIFLIETSADQRPPPSPHLDRSAVSGRPAGPDRRCSDSAADRPIDCAVVRDRPPPVRSDKRP